MIVQELIDHLSRGDPQARVVVFDHFGQVIDVPLNEFVYVTHEWTSPPVTYLQIPIMDIGPEPE